MKNEKKIIKTLLILIIFSLIISPDIIKEIDNSSKFNNKEENNWNYINTNVFPYSSKYEEINNQSNRLNFTAIVDGNGSSLDAYISSSDDYGLDLMVPSEGIVTEMNYSLSNPYIINSTTMSVNNSLLPNYTITWENRENIGKNATVTLIVNSSNIYPLDNISILVNSSKFLNFSGDGTHIFNVSKTLPEDANVTFQFYSETYNLYTSESINIEFFSTVINSINYTINFTRSVYKNQEGTIIINTIDGTNSTIGDINVTWNNILYRNYTGEGIYTFSFRNETVGSYVVSVLIYASTDILYANETFEIDIIDHSNKTVTETGYGQTIIEVEYNNHTKKNENASVWIQLNNVTGYTHGGYNVSIDSGTNNTYTESSIIFVNKTTETDSNITIYFYNSTNEINRTVTFNISFFDDFNYNHIHGFNYSIYHPTLYYNGTNTTFYLNVNEGTNLTIGNIGFYHNNSLNNTFSGSGFSSYDIFISNIGSKEFIFEINRTGDVWIVNNSLSILYTEYSYYNLTILTNTLDRQDTNYFNTTSGGEQGYAESFAMEFTMPENGNITDFNLYCNYSIDIWAVTGYLILEVRKENITGTIIESNNYFFATNTFASWINFDFETESLDAGEKYYLIVNGSQFWNDRGILDDVYNYFSWYYSPGEHSSHNASYYNGNGWNNLNNDFIFNFTYEKWNSTDFNHVSLNGTIKGQQEEMVKINSNLASINFSSNDGPWEPDTGLDNISLTFSGNVTCKVDINFDVLYNVTQSMQGTTNFQILNTSSQIEPILWNFTYSPVEIDDLFSNDELKINISNYRTAILIPNSWYLVNKSYNGYTEFHYLNKTILINASASAHSWNFSALSVPVTSSITILEAIGNEMAKGEETTVTGNVPANNVEYNSSLSVWNSSNSIINISSISNSTSNFLFPTFTLPEVCGMYEAYFYWCNGTDVAQNSFNFTVKERARIESLSEYIEADYLENCSIELNYTDYYEFTNITDGLITSDWINDWSYQQPIGDNGIYQIELNTTGLFKETKIDINISISSPEFKNLSILIPVFILADASLIFSYNFNPSSIIVNQTLSFVAIYSSLEYEFDLKNDTGATIISSKINTTIITTYTTIEQINDEYYYLIDLNLSDYNYYPQLGDHLLNITFDYKGENAHYYSLTKSINLKIQPQNAILSVNFTNADLISENNFTYDKSIGESVEIRLNLKKLTPLDIQGEFRYEILNNASINATLEGSNYTLNCTGDGLYSFIFDSSNLAIGIFEINFSVCERDIDGLSLIFNLEIIQRLEVVFQIGSFPREITEHEEVLLTGRLFLSNGSDLIPFSNAEIKITITFIGHQRNKIESYIVLTDSDGYFSLEGVKTLSFEKYYSINISLIALESPHSFESQYISQTNPLQSNIAQNNFYTIIIQIITIFLIGMLAMLVIFKIIIPVEKAVKLRKSEGDPLISRKKDLKRLEMKSRLNNYLKIPDIEKITDFNITQTQNSEVKSNFNVVFVPPDENKSNQFGKIKQIEEEIISKDLLMFKKERFLNAALNEEKMQNYGTALDFYEKAAIYSEKLGLFQESMIYFGKYESILKFLEEISAKEEKDNMIVSFFKARLWHWNNRDFIKDMKTQVKNIEGIISPPEIVYPKVKTAKELHEEIIKEEKDTKKGSMKKNSNVKVIIPKGISAPFVSKKQAKHYWEYRKMIEDMEKDTHELF